jgi:hypothetical protein
LSKKTDNKGPRKESLEEIQQQQMSCSSIRFLCNKDTKNVNKGWLLLLLSLSVVAIVLLRQATEKIIAAYYVLWVI